MAQKTKSRTRPRATRSKASAPVRWKSRTTWRFKLEKDQQRKIVPVPRKMQARLGPGTLLIPRPLDVDEAIRQTQRGELITVRAIRQQLAERYGADSTCPLCAGIFLRIAAEAAAEDERGGRRDVTPFWRVVDENGELNPKFPGGVGDQARRLLAEGHKIVLGRGKRPRVAGFNQSTTTVGILVCE